MEDFVLQIFQRQCSNKICVAFLNIEHRALDKTAVGTVLNCPQLNFANYYLCTMKHLL